MYALSTEETDPHVPLTRFTPVRVRNQPPLETRHRLALFSAYGPQFGARLGLTHA